ncbi:MAG: MATE family efflux transporter [Rikenellaceae bacterium]
MNKTFAIDNKLATEKISKLLLMYSIPSVIGMVATSIYNIVDRIFIGQGVGAMAISGLTLTFPLMNIITAIGTLIGVGAASRLSIVLGMNDIKWARNITAHTLMLTFFMSAVTVTGMMLFLEDILLLFGGSEQTIPYAMRYLHIVLPGSVFTNLCYSFSNMMRASGNPRKAMYAILLGVSINIILDPIFIFVFDMGIRGAAIATVISMFIGGVFAISHFMNPKQVVRFTAKSFAIKKYIIFNILSIGAAPFIVNLASAGVAGVINMQLMKHGGDLSVGAFGIINSYLFIIVMSVVGVANGMQPIVGFNFGAGLNHRVIDAFKLTVRVSTVIVSIGFILCQLCPRLLSQGFTSDAELLDITTQGLRIATLVFPIIGFQVVSGVFFQAISRAKQAIFISLTRQILFLIPCILVLSHYFGIIGIWASIAASDLLSSLVTYIVLRKELVKLKS